MELSIPYKFINVFTFKIRDFKTVLRNYLNPKKEAVLKSHEINIFLGVILSTDMGMRVHNNSSLPKPCSYYVYYRVIF